MRQIIVNSIINSISPRNRVLTVLFLLSLGTPLFFLGGPGAHGTRSFVALWDLGHVLFFSLTSWLLCRLFKANFSKMTVSILYFYVFLLVLVLGVVVEGLQTCFDGRTPDVHDILRNQLGCLIAFAFLDSGRKSLGKGILFLFRGAVGLLVAASLYPLGRSVFDEQVALNQFPLLSDFETPFEIDRWYGDALLRVQEGIARDGKYSLRVQLSTDIYSGVGLRYFPKDWKGYEKLHVSIFLPDKDKLQIVCRIHDFEHNNEHTDRFNRSFVLEQGWNDLVIPLIDIEGALINRLMHMDKIENLKLFVSSQDKEQIIYIDHVYLGK